MRNVRLLPEGRTIAAVRQVTGRRHDYFLAFFCLLALVVNHALFRLGSMPIVWTIVVLAVVVGLAIFVPRFSLLEGVGKVDVLHPRNIRVGALILAPLTVTFVLGWNREMPFSGDSYFQVGQSYRMALWWLSPVVSPVVKVPNIEDLWAVLDKPWQLVWSRVSILVLAGILALLLYRWNRRVALIFATAALVGWGLLEHSIFLRYPGAGYFLALPFLGPAFFLDNLELAGRLTGIIAAFAWLFALRPWLVGRWPDLAILPVALFLFWHKDVIYYFDSVYLEPWAVIFALLAIEILIVRGPQGAPAACVMIGCAALFKEPFILALPFVWLAGMPWRIGLAPPSRLTAAAIAAGIPFVIYYAARQSVDIADIEVHRTFTLAYSAEHLRGYLHHAWQQLEFAFPGPGAIAAATVLAAIAVALCQRKRESFALLCLLVAAICVILLFALDAQSARWAGYFRFLLCALPFLAAGLLVLGHSWRPKTVLAIGLLLLVLQAPGAWTALARAAGPPSSRNFVEHYDAPIVFPIKSIIAEARKEGALPQGASIRANLADGTLRPLPRSPVTYGRVGELYCECNSEHPHVLALFVRFTNMNARLIENPPEVGSRAGHWQEDRAARPQCLAAMHRTCGRVFQRVEGNEMVALLGVMQRK